MKKKISIKTKAKSRNEFRFHPDRVPHKKKKIRHPKYIWRERGNIYDYHSITHSQFVNGVKYKKLRKNPSPGDTRDAYYNPTSESDLKSTFGRKEKRWNLHPDDIKDIHKNKKIVDSADFRPYRTGYQLAP